VKRLALVTLFIALGTAFPSAVGTAGRRDTDENDVVTRLNKRKLACLAVAIHEMERRGWSFRNYQVGIWDHGSYYDIGFMGDPLDITTTGGPGHSWHIRKRDLKILAGPLSYR
jgi:hypothetical protein